MAEAELQMKDQYFGDVNDFRKYGLLRLLAMPDHLRLGICWMLTEPDRRTDGKHLGYLQQPEKYRQRDSELFDWLQQVVGEEQDRRTKRIEASNLLVPAKFKSEILSDNNKERSAYFSDCRNRFADCDLIFFDPDNGLEITSTRLGNKNSCKFLYWDEVCNTFSSGASVLIYQHFIREERSKFIERMSTELRRRTNASAVFSFRTPYVLFLLASQEKHASVFRKNLASVSSFWSPKEIIAVEHNS